MTPREIEVLNLLARGFANEEIGVTLGVETITVKHHIYSAAGKLHVHSRVLLAHYWVEVCQRTGISTSRLSLALR